MTFLSLVKLVHLIGLIMGFGGAILADCIILKGAILNPIMGKTISAARSLSHIVFVGLGLLWLSGLILVAIRVSADPHVWENQKIWAKVIIVCILTINGIAVHKIAMGHLASRYCRKLFSANRPNEMAGLTLIAAISSVSWFVPFVLGVATEFNFTVKAITILGIYACLILMGWAAFYLLAYFTCERPRARQSNAQKAGSQRAVARPTMNRPLNQRPVSLLDAAKHHHDQVLAFELAAFQESLRQFTSIANSNARYDLARAQNHSEMAPDVFYRRSA